MNTLSDPEAPMHLTWVADDGGQPRIRWARIVALVLAVFGFYMAVSLLLSFSLGMQFRFAVAFLMTLGVLSGLVVAVELQRQRVLTGRWSFRLSISALLILTTLAALFFLVIGNDLNAMRLGHEANRVTKAELEELMDGGDAYISSPDGTGVTCSITRASFSDAELVALIQISARRSQGVSQIAYLNLEKTSVTDVGVRRLDSCPHLYLLALPRMALSDEAISNIAKCKELTHLLMAESNLTAKQFTALRNSLPKLKLIGTWKERK